jgi:hypothetical protein
VSHAGSVGVRRSHPWAGFGAGPPPHQLPPDRAREEKRRDLLRMFESEEGELLVRLFGGCERYRPIDDVARALVEPPPRGYLRIGGCHWSSSALVVLAAVLSVVALLAGVVGSALVAVLGGRTLAIGVAVALACFVAGLGLRRGLSRPTMWVHAAAALGIGSAVALLA